MLFGNFNFERDFPEQGKQCDLHRPVKGYRRGTIVDKNGYRFVVEFSSGLRDEFYPDEIDIDDYQSPWY